MGWGTLPLRPEDFFGEALDAGTGEEDPFEAVILPLQELVVYPQMVTPLFVRQNESLQALPSRSRKTGPSSS